MQVIKDLFFIKIQRTTVKVQGDVRQATCVIGKSALAFAGKFNGTLQFVVERCKFWN